MKIPYLTQDYSSAEYQSMIRAGLSFCEILAFLADNSATKFGFPPQKGKLLPNYDADLILLEEDPRRDIKHLVRFI